MIKKISELLDKFKNNQNTEQPVQSSPETKGTDEAKQLRNWYE